MVTSDDVAHNQENLVFGPQNISEASQQNSISVFSYTTEDEEEGRRRRSLC